jgi:general secretion pathway protein A
VLLIDEAQEMAPPVLSELRLMSSARFDSQPLLCVVLAGNARLPEKLRREDLVPLGSRIRTRLAAHASSSMRPVFEYLHRTGYKCKS